MPKGIYKRTQYHRDIISKSKKGTHYSVEARLNMNKNKIGVPRPQWVKDKISASNLGKKFSEATRKRMGDSHRGKKRKPFTLETRIKISDSRKGSKSYLWQGGKTELKKSIKNTLQYKEWRLSVYKRDNFSCVGCGIHNDDLNCDHIKPYALIIKEKNIESVEQALNCPELWDIDNGRTLCYPCHKLTPTYGINSKYVTR